MKNYTEVHCNCKECGQPMDIVFQPMPDHLASVIHNGKLGSALATCKIEGCEFFGVTLTPERHAALTETEREAYRIRARDINRRLSEPVHQHKYDPNRVMGA